MLQEKLLLLFGLDPAVSADASYAKASDDCRVTNISLGDNARKPSTDASLTLRATF